MTTWWDGRIAGVPVSSVSVRADIWGPGLFAVVINDTRAIRVADWDTTDRCPRVEVSLGTPGLVEVLLVAGWRAHDGATPGEADWTVRP